MTVALVAVLLALVNHQRVEHGDQPVHSSVPLIEAAASCPERGELACAGRFGYRASVIGVDTAWGQRWPREVVAAWLRSAPHRAILLTPRFTSAGAVRRGRWWRLVLAAPAAH